MTTKTRYFVVGSLLTLTIGLGVGLVAYSVGFSTAAFTNQGGPAELQFVPANASHGASGRSTYRSCPDTRKSGWAATSMSR